MCAKFKWLTLVWILCLGPQWIMAQIPVSGKVGDQQSGEPIPGVNIAVINALHGTVTDAQGAFAIEVKDSLTVLSFSAIGYLPQRLQVGEEMEVRLQPSLTDLAQVVVSAGSGSQLRTDAPIAI